VQREAVDKKRNQKTGRGGKKGEMKESYDHREGGKKRNAKEALRQLWGNKTKTKPPQLALPQFVKRLYIKNLKSGRGEKKEELGEKNRHRVKNPKNKKRLKSDKAEDNGAPLTH